MEWSVEVVYDAVAVAIGVGILLEGKTHDEPPEEQIDGWRHRFADERLAQSLKKIKRLQIRKNRRREECKASYSVRIAMRVLDGDGDPASWPTMCHFSMQRSTRRASIDTAKASSSRK